MFFVLFLFSVITLWTAVHPYMDHGHVSFCGFQPVSRFLTCIFAFILVDVLVGVNYTSQCLVTTKEIRVSYCFLTEIITSAVDGGMGHH